VAFTPDGRYRSKGALGGAFWHVINLCRFEPGKLVWRPDQFSIGGLAVVAARTAVPGPSSSLYQGLTPSHRPHKGNSV
jgi:hypothetical protein